MRRGKVWIKVVMVLCLGYGLVLSLARPTTPTVQFPPQLKAKLGYSGGVLTVAFSTDGRFVLTGSVDNTARLWEVATGKEVRRFEGHQEMIYSVAFSRNGHFVLTGSADMTSRLWEVATGKEIRRFEGHDTNVFSVAFFSRWPNFSDEKWRSQSQSLGGCYRRTSSFF
ncbi:MAG: WD40 repeat domain-containing protein [Candidatus Hodarchaeota archaeon]